MTNSLTETTDGDKSCWQGGRLHALEEGRQHVLRNGVRRDRTPDGTNDDRYYPEPEEGNQGPEGLEQKHVVSPGLLHHDGQLGQRQGATDVNDSAHDPEDECDPDRAAWAPENTRRRDEDPRPYDDSNLL